MATTTKKSWTAMVYMAGDNSLDPEGVQDLKEMKKVGSTDKLNIVAQFDRAAGHVARRYYLRKGGIVTGDAVASLGAVNTGDPKCLSDFIQWGVKSHPADHYLLVLWNHGQGWDDTDIYADERHLNLRRLASGPIRHALFHSSVRRTLEQASSDNTARAILLDDNAKDFLDNLEMKNESMGSDSIENNEPPYLETWRALMLSMLKKINQEGSVAALHKVIVQLTFLHAQPYGQATGIQPHTELINRYLMQ